MVQFDENAKPEVVTATIKKPITALPIFLLILFSTIISFNIVRLLTLQVLHQVKEKTDRVNIILVGVSLFVRCILNFCVPLICKTADICFARGDICRYKLIVQI